MTSPAARPPRASAEFVPGEVGEDEAGTAEHAQHDQDECTEPSSGAPDVPAKPHQQPERHQQAQPHPGAPHRESPPPHRSVLLVVAVCGLCLAAGPLECCPVARARQVTTCTAVETWPPLSTNRTSAWSCSSVTYAAPNRIGTRVRGRIT